MFFSYRYSSSALEMLYMCYIVSQNGALISPKVALNLWQKLHKKLGKVVLKFHAILHIFGCKILLAYEHIQSFETCPG